MWRTMHKLTRTFADQPQPKRSAERYKMKLNEFKEHLPLLQTFCNQGLRDRHWERVGGAEVAVAWMESLYVLIPADE